MNHVFAARPVGSRTAVASAATKRPSLWPVVAYSVAIIAGATVTALVISGAGSLIREALGAVPLAASAAVLGLVAVAAQARGRVAPLPERRRQVPTRWLAWRRWKTAVGYGFLLGNGFWTLLHHAAVYVLVACLLLMSPLSALLVAVVYGGARAAMLVAAWLATPSASLYERIANPDTSHVARLLPAFAALTTCASVVLFLHNL
jgi:hypothetical protein